MVQLERDADALWVTLDRPERRNAYSARIRDELVVALELAASDPSVASVHLRGRRARTSAAAATWPSSVPGPIPPRPTASASSGPRGGGSAVSAEGDRPPSRCLRGAGIELSAFAGAVEANDAATVSLPEVSMGLIPGAGGTASIPRRIGPQRAAWLALTGVRLDARPPTAWGLIDRLVARAGWIGEAD